MTTRDRRPGQLGDWGVLGFGVLVGVAVVALLVAAYAIGNTKGKADARRELTATQPPSATTAAATVDQQAVALFATSCGSCHTLSVAGTTGAVGPNLDELKPTAEQVVAAVENGGAGSGQMPAGLLSGTDAERVAELVSGGR